jgi:hypothetical protein
MPPARFQSERSVDLPAILADTFGNYMTSPECTPVSALQEIHRRLVVLETKLSDRPDEADEVRAIRQLLDSDEGSWIGTVEAQRLLDAYSVSVVETWVKRGWLRSKQLPDGQLQVSLEDVLHRREVNEALSAMGSIDRPLTDEEREYAHRPASPEVEAIIAPILEMAEARLAELRRKELAREHDE